MYSERIISFMLDTLKQCIMRLPIFFSWPEMYSVCRASDQLNERGASEVDDHYCTQLFRKLYRMNT